MVQSSSWRQPEAALGAAVARVSSSGDGLNYGSGTVPRGKLMGEQRTPAHVWSEMAGFASLKDVPSNNQLGRLLGLPSSTLDFKSKVSRSN